MEGQNLPPAALGPADNHQMLREFMLANNTLHAKRFHYFDFHVFKGKLWCMFEIKETERLQVTSGHQS